MQSIVSVHKDNFKDYRFIQDLELTLRALANFESRCETLCVAILSKFTATKSQAELQNYRTTELLELH